MATRPKFSAVETASGWMVSVPANMSSSGKRVRKFFASEQDAKRFGKSLRAKYHEGQRGGHISHELAVMAGSAADLLEPHGVTILDAARAYIASLGDTSSTETFGERYARAMLDGEAHWSAIYCKDMGKLDRWLGKELMAARCSSMTPLVVRDALIAHGAKAQSTLDHRTRYVNSVLNFKPRHRKQAHIAIMTIRQVAMMLRTAETKPERWAAALLVFAGIRPDAEDGEITRLDWSAVGDKTIYVSGDISKTGTDRHIPITPRLKRLLRGHPKSGPVTPPNWRRVYRKLRRGAGIGREQDITRHTFASHYLAAFGEHATKQAMGHTEGSSTLMRHYRRAVTEEAGRKFFR